MVTRETFEPAVAALGGSPEAADRLLVLHRLLAEVAVPRGFLGPRELPRLAHRHILQSAALVPLLGADAGGPVVDVGSGAGLPGLVLGCLGVRPLVLIEAEGRRGRFLEQAAETLDLDVMVVIERAEVAGRDPGLRDSCRAGVARALAQPAVSLEFVLPFVRPGGVAVLMVGESVDVAQGSAAAHELAGSDARLEVAQVPGSEDACRVMIVNKDGVTPARYPRRTGVPARRPLGTEP